MGDASKFANIMEYVIFNVALFLLIVSELLLPAIL